MPDLVPAAIPAGRLCSLPQPTLQAGQLTLRPWRPSDAEAIVEAYRDPDIRHWHVQSMTEDEALTWLASWPERWRAETGAGWAVTQLDVLVGRVGFRSITLREGHAELAYWTVRAARGRNIAPRAVRAVSTWMFQSVGLHRIELCHSALNPVSCRVADKAGFRYEGTRRQHLLHRDGWHDMHLHAQLAADETAG